ncbi:MAG TPA: nucleotidyltransferase domain-containing protein [Candidatus Andersenbacteria bacterium]|nr:nucleotidyltransferase domain-containing protein [Candidatus Andersenbacteria bacterium]
MEISQQLKEQIREVLREHNVTVAYLFGSLVKGSQHADSDIDVAVVPAAMTAGETTDDVMDNITADISAKIKLPERRVDVSHLADLPLSLRFSVQRDGLPIYVKDERIQRETFLRDAALYHDQYPFIKAANARFAKRLRNESD